MAKGEGTRSGLLWEVERLLNESAELPQILLMENVTQVHSVKNKEHFDKWIEFLESKGYSNYWKDLNAKNFGIPQNRNRTFMVSVLGNYTYEFPKEFSLELRLKDMLEDSVDEKFYISNERVESIVNSTFAQEKTRIQRTDVCGTLLARDYKDPKCVEVEPNNRVIVFTNNKKGYDEAVEGDSINLEQPNSKTRRGRVGHGVAQTLNTAPQQAIVEPQLRIRKLTPKECYRLMGFDDVDFEKAARVNSDSQLYKQAGNSIVVQVLEKIFLQMGIEKSWENSFTENFSLRREC